MICGIDPGGASGYISFISKERTEIHKMPKTIPDLIEFFEEDRDQIKMTFLEDVQGVGQWGARNFAFGENVGSLKAILTFLDLPFILVHPRLWKAHYNLIVSKRLEKERLKNLGEKYKDKFLEKELAQQLFPKLKINLKNADAMLIAEYGRRLNLV